MAEQMPWDVDWSAKAPPVAAQNPWEVDWSAHSAAPSLAHEAAAVGITGPVKGLLAVPGLPGDIAQMGKSAGEAALSYLPEVPSPAPDSTLGRLVKFLREESARTAKLPIAQVGSGDLPGSYEPVTSAQLQQGVEKLTGPLPQAETEAGKIGQTITEFAPAALALGPGEGIKGAAANFTKLAALPGAASEYLGEKTQGTWLEPIARLTGALAGGGLGAAGGKVAEAVANRAAAGKAAAAAGGDVSPAALRKVAANYQADELNPQIVAQRQADLGPEAMMLDMGRQLGERAGAVATQGGKGQNQILNSVQERVHGRDQFGLVNEEGGAETANRIRNTLDITAGPSQDVVALRNSAIGPINDAIDRFLGPSPDIVASRNGINQTVDQIARPLYEQVMNAHDVVNVPDAITSRPAVAQAMRDAVSLARNHGEQLVNPVETRTILQGDGYHIADDIERPAQTSLRYWDYVKKAMDARIQGMLKSGGIQDLGSQEKADLAGLQAARTALVNHLDNTTGGAYGVARRAAATKFQVNDAIDLGRSALNGKLLPEELAEEMQGMSLPEQAGVRLGMRREMQRVIDSAPDDAASARRLLDTNQSRQKIAQVFGQNASNALDRWVGLHDALPLGRDALNTRLLPEELADRMRNMSPAETGLVRAGMRREIDRIIDVARNDGAAARRLLDTNQNREKIAQVFGQSTAHTIDRQIAAETRFQTAANNIAGNSRTAVRTQLGKDTEAASVAQPPSATVLGLAHAGLRRGQEYLGDLSLERTREGIGNLLTRRGAQIPRLAQILADYNTARAANAAGPTVGRQAGSLAALLAGQTPGYVTGFLPGPRPSGQSSP